MLQIEMHGLFDGILDHEMLIIAIKNNELLRNSGAFLVADSVSELYWICSADIRLVESSFK